MIVVVIGASGSGTTTIGTALAVELGSAFLDADALHPDANIQAAKGETPLDDGDGARWLVEVHARLLDAFHRGDALVVACSALKYSHRRLLSSGVFLTWVYLKGDLDVIRLEELPDAIVVDMTRPPDTIVQQILGTLRDKPDIRVLEDLRVLSDRVAATLVAIIDATVRQRGRCSLVLSGGSTPVTLQRLLATEYRSRIPWSQVDVFWGDERYVPHDDVRSNYRMARETLLDHVPCPAGNVHPMPTHLPDPNDAASDYETTLRRYWNGGEPQFDLVLLGVGPDGHTASLFRGSAALHERVRLVLAATVPAEPPRRLTLTFPAFARAAHVHVLVSGADKAVALAHVFSGADRSLYPAAGVRAAKGPVVWWLDRDAASALTFQ